MQAVDNRTSPGVRVRHANITDHTGNHKLHPKLASHLDHVAQSIVEFLMRRSIKQFIKQALGGCAEDLEFAAAPEIRLQQLRQDFAGIPYAPYPGLIRIHHGEACHGHALSQLRGIAGLALAAGRHIGTNRDT